MADGSLQRSLGCLAQPGRCAVGSLALRDVELGTLFDRGHDGDLGDCELEARLDALDRLICDLLVDLSEATGERVLERLGRRTRSTPISAGRPLVIARIRSAEAAPLQRLAELRSISLSA